MILTFLIVSMPPIAGRFFGETAANGFMHYSAFGGFARPSALGPAGSYAAPANNKIANTGAGGSGASTYNQSVAW